MQNNDHAVLFLFVWLYRVRPSIHTHNHDHTRRIMTMLFCSFLYNCTGYVLQYNHTHTHTHKIMAMLFRSFWCNHTGYILQYNPLKPRQVIHHVCVCVCVCVCSPRIKWLGINRVVQNHTYIRIYGVYTVFLSGKLSYIRSYVWCVFTVYKCICGVHVRLWPNLGVTCCAQEPGSWEKRCRWQPDSALYSIANVKGWPEPYIYPVYDRIFGDFPAKNTVCTPYIHGSGQPYKCCRKLPDNTSGLI